MRTKGSEEYEKGYRAGYQAGHMKGKEKKRNPEKCIPPNFCWYCGAKYRYAKKEGEAE